MRNLWPTGGLWRHRDFLKLWSAETISQFGSMIDDLAFPLVAILVLDASAFEVAALGTVLFLPFILFTLPAGVWVDRLPRRPILIVGDFGRAALYMTVPIAYIADVLTLAQLYVVGFLVGVFQVFFDVAYQSYLPSLVDRDKIIEGNSKFEVSRSAAQISGPGLGGILVQVLTAPYAILVDALTFVASGLFILGIRTREPRPERTSVDGERPSFLAEAKEGLRFVFANPNLRAQAGCTATSNFFFSLGFSIFLVFAVRELELSPGLIGIVFSVGAVGSMLAAFTARRISGRFGIGRTTIAVTLLSGPAMLLIAFAPEGNAAIPFLVAAQLVLGFALVIYNIVQVSYRQAICPARLQGRMNSAMRFLVWGTIPLGTLAGGALGTWIGLRETLVVAAIGGGLSFLWILLSPQRHLREMPEPIEDEPVQSDLAPGSRESAIPCRPTPPDPVQHGVMPELPEVEAWVRELDPLVSRSPVDRAGPAHVATLKTIDPPLASLEGRRLSGLGEAREEPPLPDRGRGTRAPRPPDERRAPALPRAWREGAEDVDVPAPLHRRRRARAHRGREEEARRRLARHTRAARRRTSPTSGRTRSTWTWQRSREILGRERRQLHPLLRDQRALAGIGRAHANEILLRARLSPFKASTELSDDEISAARDGDPRRPGACARAPAARQGRPRRVPDPQPALGAVPAVRYADRARGLRRAHDLLLPELPDRRAHAEGPPPLAAPSLTSPPGVNRCGAARVSCPRCRSSRT